MNSEIEGYQDQLLSVKQDAPGIVGNLSDEQFHWRPDVNRWSIAECFDHLNKAARLFMNAFDVSLADARARHVLGSGPFAYPAHERLFIRMMEPPAKPRLRAPGPFVPSYGRAPADIMREFFEWQEAFGQRLREADGIDLRRTRTRSPVLTWLTYSLGAGFAGFLAHERRHLWQARIVRNDPAFP